MRGEVRGLIIVDMEWRRLFLGLVFLLLLGCGSNFVWFFSFNTGPVDPNGLVVVIGTPRASPLESVAVVAGDLPKGMKLMEDGTVQGVPEETGHFEFTLEFIDTDGSTDLQSFSVDLNP